MNRIIFRLLWTVVFLATCGSVFAQFSNPAPYNPIPFAPATLDAKMYKYPLIRDSDMYKSPFAFPDRKYYIGDHRKQYFIDKPTPTDVVDRYLIPIDTQRIVSVASLPFEDANADLLKLISLLTDSQELKAVASASKNISNSKDRYDGLQKVLALLITREKNNRKTRN